MRELTAVVAVAVLAVLAAYFVLQSVYETSPPSNGERRDIINAAFSALAATLLAATAAFIIHSF